MTKQRILWVLVVITWMIICSALAYAVFVLGTYVEGLPN